MLCRMRLCVGFVHCPFVVGVVCCYVELYLCVDLCVCRRCRCKHMLGVLGLVYLGKVWIWLVRYGYNLVLRLGKVVVCRGRLLGVR